MTHSFHLQRGCWHGTQDVALAMGNFDGVHRGHQRIIQQLHATEALPLVMSFAPHPKNRLTGEALPLLTPYRDRAFWLQHYGAYAWWLLSFSQDLRRLSPEDFVRHYFLPARVRHVCVGTDFRFGYQARGDIDTLARLGQRYDFQLHLAANCEVDGERVSSTRIRHALLQHDFATVEALLGHKLTLTGRIVHGAARGRKLNAPTANLHLGEDFAAPNGVYVLRWGQYWGVGNIGYAPTFSGQKRKLEAHFFTENALDLYGQILNIELYYFMRPEKRFDHPQDLQKQIQKDVEEAHNYIHNKYKELL